VKIDQWNIRLSIFESELQVLAFRPTFYGTVKGEGIILEMCNFDMGLVVS
jgi:hypothetical protein